MKRSLLILSLFIATQTLYAQGEDAEGSKDHPMFPNRMPNYLISEYSNNFDAVEFNLAANGSKMVTKEGTKTAIIYGFDNDSGKPMPSVLHKARMRDSCATLSGRATPSARPRYRCR